MMSRKAISSLMFFIALCVSVDAYGFEISVEPHSGALYGYTLYNISGVDYDPSIGYFRWQSELNWPIDSYVAGLTLVANEDPLTVKVSARKNLTSDTGKMEDSDLINGYLLIFSRSDTTMDMLDLSIKTIVSGGGDNNAGLALGFGYQDFSFKASNVVQFDASGNRDSVDGPVGTYRIRYYIPFVGGSYAWGSTAHGTLDLDLMLGFVAARDEDDHLLRFKKSTGEGQGYAFEVEGAYEYFFSRYFIKAGGRYLRIEASGTQYQRFYAGPDEGLTFKNIDLSIESSQVLFAVGAGVRF